MADIVWSSTHRPPAFMQLGLRSNSLAYVSPLTGAVQTASLPGARWTATLRWNNLTRADADPILATLLKLRGSANRLILWDLAHPRFRGTATGPAQVDGGSQTGNTLAIATSNVSRTNWCLEGDKIGVNGELKMITAAGNTNGSGDITVTFEPPLRASPGDTQQVVIDSPTAKFILTDQEVRWSTSRAGVISDLEIQLVEAF